MTHRRLLHEFKEIQNDRSLQSGCCKQNIYEWQIKIRGPPNSVYENETPNVSSHIFELDIPILGICYGMQTMVNQLGGTVVNSNEREWLRKVTQTLN